MSFVKTSEEVKDIEALIWQQVIIGERLSVEATSTKAFLDSIIPPGLTLAGEPKVTFSVGRGQGWGGGEYASATMGVMVRRGERVGGFVLRRWCTHAFPNQFGRELLGEVKRPADIEYFRDQEFVTGWVARLGSQLLKIESTVGDDLGPVDETVSSFEIKAFPAAMAPGFEYPPLLLSQTFLRRNHMVRKGEAELTLGGNTSDPLDEIPIISVGEATLKSTEITIVTESKEELCENPSDYWPYFLGRNYDDVRTFPTALRRRKLDSERLTQVPTMVGRV